ncbi:MAG TPA: DNA translocase FtsK 4TM domain-containing protein [Gammaproteobacteria bacterium]|nr:DNA translocase FtsK 4TM domain-containing protein [Gammaproteobacteria bacterium]
MRSRTRYQQQPIKNVKTVKNRWREGMVILSIAAMLLLFAALFTYDRSGGNASGAVGSLFASAMLYIFGYIAFLLPLSIPYGVWLATHPKPDEDEDEEEVHHSDSLIWRGLGFFLALVSSCGLAAIQVPHLVNEIPYSGGGVFGSAVAMGLVETFSLLGTTVLLFSFFLCGMTLFTGLSWLNVADFLGKWTLNFFALFKREKSEDEEEYDDEEDSDEEEDEDEENTSKTGKKSKGPAVKKLRQPQDFDLPTSFTRREPIFVEQLEDNPRAAKIKTTTLKTYVKPIVRAGLPSLDLLDLPEVTRERNYSPQGLELMSREVEARLKDFGILVQVVAAHPGPVVTRFEMQLAPGIKVSRIVTLAKDLARSLSVISVRVVEVIPGKSVVGLELPNQHREIVRLSEVLSSPSYQEARSPVSLALGKDIAGHPVVVDLSKMPHLLVAGTTGSGKSVGLNAMLLSFLFKSCPEDVRMIMIDPKMLELSIYEGIPHLLAPVVTDMKEAASALRWCVCEMDRRYRQMSALGVRNLAGYNAKIAEAQAAKEPLVDPLWRPTPDGPAEAPKLQKLPYIVVVVDEFADLFMVVGKKIEELIARIAQKARAAGIHLILATQRPSVDVITGLIKANIPTRIAFQVSSRIDSRTILDQQGAEQLLGHGDMLYLAPGTGVPVRVHGAYVADDEVHKVVEDWKTRGTPEYIEGLFDDGIDDEDGEGGEEGDDENAESDPLYDEAVKIVVETRRASISGVQRRLKIGYNRAARILEAMEDAGIVSPMESNGQREILVPEGQE